MSSTAPIVSLAQFKSVVDLLLKTKKAAPDMFLTPIVHGMHGVGKTSVMQQLAAENGYNFVVMHPAHSRLEDLIGIPHSEGYSYVRDGVEVHAKRTVYSQPEWIAKILSDPRPALLLVDEFNRARDLEVHQAMIPFLLEGHLGPHSIRQCDLIVAAANPDCPDYEVTPIGDCALLSRFAHFTLEPEGGEWSAYNSKRGDVHAAVLETFMENPGLCPKTSVPSEARVKVFPDRRNLTRFGRVMHCAEKGGYFDRQSVVLLGFGLLGSDATNQLMAKLDQIAERGRSLTVEAVLSGEAVKALDTVKEVEKIIVLNSTLADGLASGEIDLDKCAVRKGRRGKKASAVAGEPRTARQNLEQWLLSINIEHLYMFVQALKARHTERKGGDAKEGNHQTYLFLKSIDAEILAKVLRHNQAPAPATAAPSKDE